MKNENHEQEDMIEDITLDDVNKLMAEADQILDEISENSNDEEELDEAKKTKKESDDCDDDDSDDDEDDKDDDDSDDDDDKDDDDSDDDDDDDDLDEAAEINSDKEFKAYAEKVLSKAHGDKYNKAKADKMIEGILKKADGDYGAAVGVLQSSLGESESKKNESVVDFANDLNSLVEETEGLSEEFKEKAGTLFEVALTTRLREESERLQEEFDDRIVEETAKIRESLEEKIDNYLTYAVESWVEDNKIALEAGLRTEVAENFIDALKNVFVEHYIEVPETKKDLVAELETKLTEAQEALSEKAEEAETLAEEVEKLSREKILAEAAESLADTQRARLASLAQDIEFVNEETFRKKVSVIKECYFRGNNADTIEEDVDDSKSSYQSTEVIVENNDDNSELSPTMQHYMKALGRISKADVIRSK